MDFDQLVLVHNGQCEYAVSKNELTAWLNQYTKKRKMNGAYVFSEEEWGAFTDSVSQIVGEESIDEEIVQKIQASFRFEPSLGGFFLTHKSRTQDALHRTFSLN